MPKKLLLATILSVLSIIFVAPQAFADKCKDPIVDETNLLDASAKEQLQNGMAALTNLGADVRVLFLSSYHRNDQGEMNKNLAEYRDTMLAKCKSWKAADGGFKNNLILFTVVPKKKSHAVYYGGQWSPRLSSNEARYNNDMSGRFRDGDTVGGVLIGISDVADLISVKPSQEGKAVVINHPANFSGLWKVFGWIIALGAIGLLAWLAFWIFGQTEKRRAAQREAQTERGRCSQALNAIEGLLAILKAKIAQASLPSNWVRVINESLDRAEASYNEAAARFNGLNRSSNNPDTPRLSVTEYSAMKNRYAGAATLFANAEQLIAQTEENLRSALRGDEPKRNAPTQDPPVPQMPTNPVNTGAQTVHDRHTKTHHKETIIIRDSPVIIPTPIVIDDRDRDRPMEDRWTTQRHRDPDVPVIVDEPSKGGGEQRDWGISGKGGGTEHSWGASGSGGGREQAWGGTETSSQSNEPTEERPGTGY